MVDDEIDEKHEIGMVPDEAEDGREDA